MPIDIQDPIRRNVLRKARDQEYETLDVRGICATSSDAGWQRTKQTDGRQLCKVSDPGLTPV